jgi:hypothetical protein
VIGESEAQVARNTRLRNERFHFLLINSLAGQGFGPALALLI